ncbi:MAG: peptidoglycan editing factor PgeF, partial [Candidatus Eisenbacteria bacterium]|nr:peptidoglycan editing factor PgeF [Candidatus Eisenbacteria bacterium]
MWTLARDAAVPLWRRAPAAGAAPAGAVLAFSTRQGGVSEGPYRSLNVGRSTADRPEAVAENRRRVLAALGLDPGHLATAGQVHGRDVARVTQAGLHAACDALVTTIPGVALAVTGADCLPLLFEAPGAVGVAHSGWRGTLAGAPEAALAAVCGAAGAGPGAVRVHLGPCIRICCYEVGEDVATQFPAEAVRRIADRMHLDLARAARLRLLDAGVADGSIHDVDACTACAPEGYFSHRRDHGITGRQWGLA